MSEPPDLGNWFGSYRYESPVMNSNSFRNEIDCRKSEREKEEGKLCGLMEIGSKYGFFVNKKQNLNGVVKCGCSSENELGDQCLSQISGSFESPSCLSEPTDIKNWFSSYAYESPSLDITYGFGNSICKESNEGFLVENNKRENEEDLRKCRKSSVSKDTVSDRKQAGGVANCDSSWRYTKQARRPVSEAPRPLESPSLLSEPIHIRNWFSSYVYESPSLDTNDSLGDSVCKESKFEKDGFMVENSWGDSEEDLGDLSRTVGEEVVHEKKQSVGLAKCDSSWRDTKNDREPVSKVPVPLDPLDSSSHLSEPTDIRNWFSSYVYESPSLDTADGFGDSVCRDIIDEKDEVLIETINREKGGGLKGFSKKENDSEEVDVNKVQLQEIAKYNTYQERQLVSVDLITGVDEHLSGENDMRHTHKTVQNHGISQAQDSDTSSFNKGDAQYKLDQESIHGTRFKQSNNHRSSCNNDVRCPQNLNRSRVSTLQESSDATVHAEDCVQLKNDPEFIPVKGASVRKSTHGSKERKDEGEVISEDGFITTRKRKFTAKNDENSSRGSPENSKGTAPLVVTKRKTLADTTNFHHSPATMITGKWKCPRQRKPNLGPPLKQLGLENWIKKS